VPRSIGTSSLRRGRLAARVVPVATWEDVRRIALALPQTSESESHGVRGWRVKDRGFVWERPLRRADVEALGDRAPDGPILGARVEHVGEQISIAELRDLIVDAWLAVAPKRVARDYLAIRPRDSGV
jgi:hypothetical protein